MYKADSQEKKLDNASTFSMCDLMRNNTNEVISKVESLAPTYIENFTNLQSEYFHIARDYFRPWYIFERELFNKMRIDQKTIDVFDKYLKVFTKSVVSEIEMVSNFQKTAVNNAMSVMKSYEEYANLTLSSCVKMLEYSSVLIPNTTY
ncbi:MAG TPA: hypothetical protein VFP45_01320 [Candidatus Nitrosotalea sp.]|nr:hypothetical protein [Candidatus Nitrosotalea sp.]